MTNVTGDAVVTSVIANGDGMMDLSKFNKSH